MKTIDKHYSRFGDDVKGVLQAKAKPDGDIKHMLTHLGLPVSGVIDKQHRILVEFIHTHGKSLFMKAINLSGGAVAVRRLLQETEMATIKAKRERMLNARLQGVPLAAGTPASAQTNFRPASAQTDGTKWIECETYTGPDRRRGADRRVGPRDRRASIALITFKNRRFGGKRRKSERRQA